jgi:hypothetical protein
MSNLGTAIRQAVDAQDIPGCVLAGTIRDGSFCTPVLMLPAYEHRFFQIYQNHWQHFMQPENAKALQLNIVM